MGKPEMGRQQPLRSASTRLLSFRETDTGASKSDLCDERTCGGLIQVRVRHRNMTNISSLKYYRFFSESDIVVEGRQPGRRVLQKRVELALPGRRR